MKSIPYLAITCLILSACSAPISKEANQHGADFTSQAVEIMSGQKLFVEISIENGKVTGLTSVAEIKKPKITLTFEFKPMDNGMILTVNNPLTSSLKYHIDMIDRNGKPYQTSSCPVIAGAGVFENWPHPIPKLLIKNFRLLKDDTKIECAY